MNDYPVNHSTVALYFTTHAADGSPVAPSSAFEVADVKLFKNGSDVERTSNAGWTMTSPFNSITGLHRLLIDLSDNTDAGFYAAGATYAAVLNPDETVDGLAVVKVIGEFSIGFAVAAADVAAIKAKTDNLPSDPADASVIAGRFDTLDTSVADLPTNAELATALGTADDAVLAQVALVKAKTDNLPTDPADASDIAARFTTLDAAVADLPTNAELTTALASADDAVLAQVALVKAKTDGLTFTVAGQVDANIQYVNDVQVTGNGQTGTEWGP